MTRLRAWFRFPRDARRWTCVGLVLALGASGPCVVRLGAQATPLADATALRPGAVEGRVVYAADGRPAIGARVAVANSPIATTSEREGRYRLDAVPAGTHALVVTHAGCVTARVVDVVVRPGQVTSLDALRLVWAPSPADKAHVSEEYVVEGGQLTLLFPYKYWTVTGPILQPGEPDGFDGVAVKNPTVVFHNGNWHLFYTSKPAREAREFRTALGYVMAPTLEGLRTAPRVEMRTILGESIIAPQVFFFEPQRLWYLIGHVSDISRHTLEPVYSTNPNIENVHGWSAPRHLQTNRQRKDDLWIDFWVICDEQKAHLFYSDQTGALYRMETPLADFPEGFAHAEEQVAVQVSGKNSRGDWIFYDASHIYYVRSARQYLALLEGAYAHPTRKNYWDGRNRFLFAMTADRLEGPWRRVEASKAEFVGEARWLFNPDGTASSFDPVSHPELIRAGNNQRLEIEDYRLQMLFQTFDADGVPPGYDYHLLPWQLMLMRNY